jgi:hypothetical protein
MVWVGRWWCGVCFNEVGAVWCGVVDKVCGGCVDVVWVRWMGE